MSDTECHKLTLAITVARLGTDSNYEIM